MCEPVAARLRGGAEESLARTEDDRDRERRSQPHRSYPGASAPPDGCSGGLDGHSKLDTFGQLEPVASEPIRGDILALPGVFSELAFPHGEHLDLSKAVNGYDQVLLQVCQ